MGRYEREVLPKRARDRAKSRKQEFKNIRKVFGEMPPKELTAADAWRYFQERGGTQQARHEVRALSAVMGWAVKWGAVSVNPLLNVGFPTFKPRNRYVTDAEFIAVRDLAPPMGYQPPEKHVEVKRRTAIFIRQTVDLLDNSIKGRSSTPIKMAPRGGIEPPT
jgi:hypothetical protein